MADEVSAIRKVVCLENGGEIIVVSDIHRRVAECDDSWDKRGGILSLGHDDNC